MGLDTQEMVNVIVGGTTEYLVEFLPIGAFVIGLTLAFVVMGFLVELFADFRAYSRFEGNEYRSFKQYRQNIKNDMV